MAAAHAQTMVAHNPHATSVVVQEIIASPSPTFTNPDLILPRETTYSSVSSSATSDTVAQLSHEDDSSVSGHQRNDSEGTAELLTATAVVMPARLSVQTTTVKTSAAAAALVAAYSGYEHGAPLSDIGEEESDSDSTTRDDKSRTPSPNPDGSIPPKKPRLRHKKRLSNFSTSSGGSDNTNWEDFDMSKLGSDRVAADIAHARESAEDDDTRSRTSSKELDEELAVLNERAEKILANARKRLSHMEDNLSKARHSIVLNSTRSTPNMHEVAASQATQAVHQPAGSLYRSISQNAHRKSRVGFPVKPSSPLSHARTGSDNVVPSGMKRLSRIPDVRSASALEQSRPRLGVVTPEGKTYPHSPSSSRSFNSPLRMLAEEADIDSPSTVHTSPESSAQPFSIYRGLGIHATGTKVEEDLPHSQKAKSTTPTSLERSSSQASTKSARELTEKMAEMKSRIAELKSKAQADSLKRRSMQSLRDETPFDSPSPSGNSNGVNRRRSPSPEASDRASSGIGHGTNTATNWRPAPHQGHRRRDSALEEDEPLQNPVTPITARFLGTDTTPVAMSSARTDRNTHNIANRTIDVDDLDRDEIESMIHPSNYVDAEEDFLSDDEDDVAANEEEQIYLNEALEESLQDLAPDVPTIPGEYLMDELVTEEGLSHEDRLDAFDYENMFLHSAMGTFTGRTGSDEESDNESVETSRQDVQTPTLIEEDELLDVPNKQRLQDEDDCSNDEDEIETDEEMEAAMLAQQKSFRQPPLRSPLSEVPVVNKVKHHEARKPWIILARSNSEVSNASTATFQTATEGVNTPEEEHPEEILNWGNAPAQGQAVYIQPRSPIRAVHISSPPRRFPSNSGSVSEITNGQIPGRSSSLLRNAVAGSPSPTPASSRPISASGKYRIFPSSQSPVPPRTRLSDHSRNTSMSPNQQSTLQTLTSPTPTQTQRLSPQSPPQQSPQPQSPNGSYFTNKTHPHFHRHTRSTSSQISISFNGSPQPQPVKANTTILMESLIKLADPNFSMGPNAHFEEVDKELVLGLLRAVGGVSEEILRGQAYDDGTLVRELRRRLGRATAVLVAGTELDE